MYLIRADGNASIGAGHLMRCLTIADVLNRMGERVIFICAEASSAAVAEEHGYSVFVLGSDYRDMEGELPILLPWLKRLWERPVILIDSYYVTDRYLKELDVLGGTVLLDDMGTKRYPVNTVINYNVFANSRHYGELYQGTDTDCYVGGRYVPLRPQFLNRSYEVREQVENVLITTGGGDIDNIAGNIMTAIYNNKLNYHLIIGRFNPHLEELEAFAERKPGVHIHHDVKDMAALMEQCDIAITAGGTTVYELAVVGVPFICFSYAANQEELVRYVGGHDIAGCGGAYHLEAKQTLQNIADWCRHQMPAEKRKQCHRKVKQLTDGLGAERIAGILRSRLELQRP